MTGDLWIGDVGQDQREEIDFQPQASHGGENYGWKIMEGTRCGDGGAAACPAGVPSCNARRTSSGAALRVQPLRGLLGHRRIRLPRLARAGARRPATCTATIARGVSGPTATQLDPAVPQLSTFGEDAAGEVYLGTQGGDSDPIRRSESPDTDADPRADAFAGRAASGPAGRDPAAARAASRVAALGVQPPPADSVPRPQRKNAAAESAASRIP